jgi:cyanophycin synthetase
MNSYLPSQHLENFYDKFHQQQTPLLLSDSTFLNGCNIYHRQSVFRQIVTWTSRVEDHRWVSDTAFQNAFLERFQNLPFFAPTRSRSVTLAERYKGEKGARLDELLLEAILAVEETAALVTRDFQPNTFANIEKHDNHSALVWQTSFPKLSGMAAKVAFIGLLELLSEVSSNSRHYPSQFDAALGKFLRQARSARMLDTPSLVKFVAQNRGLPVQTVGPDKIRIGQGRFQRHIISSMTDDTSVIAQKFCMDKRLANRGMRDLGLPVPRQFRVSSTKGAYEAFEKMACLVVVKPPKRSNGAGVTVGVNDFSALEEAFLRAKAFGPDVLIEECVPGDVHRLLIIDGKFSAALRYERPKIIGDAEKTIEALIEDLNRDPCRDGIRVKKVSYDGEIARSLQNLGLTLQSVLPKGETVWLRSISSMATGAMSIDCTDFVHHDNRELAERAVRSFGPLAAAGIDFATPDISRSYKEVGGRIIEINGSPGLLMHMWPGRGASRNMAEKVLDLLYPVEGAGRIPIAVVGGDRGIGTTARILDEVLRGCGKGTALSLREEGFVNGQRVEPRNGALRVRPAHLLSNLDVETLVAAMSLRRIASRGLYMDGCTVSIILDRHKEGNVDDFLKGISVLNRATTDAFVVGSGNRLALEHLEIGRRKLILVGDRLTDAPMQEHLEHGGIVIADARADGEDRLVVMKGGDEIGQLSLGNAWRRLSKGRARKMHRASKYAVAAAFGLGVAVPDIAAGLSRAATAVAGGLGTSTGDA